MDIRKFFGGPTVKKGKDGHPHPKPEKGPSPKLAKASSTKPNAKPNEKTEEKRPVESKVSKTPSKPKDAMTSNSKEKRDVSKSPTRSEKKSKQNDKSTKNAKAADISDKKPQKDRKTTTPNEKPKKARDKNSNIEDSICIDSSPEPSVVKKKRKKMQIQDSSDDEFEISKNKSSKSQKKGRIIFDSDSEESEEPLPSKPKRRSRKKEVIVFDSDDEEKHKPSIMDAFKKITPKTKSVPSAASKTKPSPRKITSAMDFFGTATVQRSDSKSQQKRKASDTNTDKHNGRDSDLEIHDDDDFEETLRTLDEQQPKKKPKLAEEDDIVEDSQSNKISLASKIAQKVKAGNKILVEDTPEKKPVISPRKKLSPKKMDSPPKKTNKTPDKKETSPNVVEDTPTLARKGSGYRSYLSRDGPQALGSKQVPDGAENCLEGLTFVISGVLEAFEREEAKSLIEKYGGKVTTTLSKKTNYLLAGRDAGESKLSKAKQFGTKQIDEDGMLDLIRTLPGKKSKYTIAAEKEIAKEAKAPAKRHSGELNKSKKNEAATPVKEISSKKLFATPDKKQPDLAPKAMSTSSPSGQKHDKDEPTLLWVDKYKPKSLKQIIGQQGDKSNAKKLFNWLNNWHKNIASGKKPAFNRFSDDGSGHRAALLSGPPGVGKTTTATLVCEEGGFSFVELNASDTRSKKSLQNELSEALNNHTLVDFFGTKKNELDGQKHCLVMDEVDGMAGNEDRGGMQELIQLIKHSKIPIICMCNDRNHPKIRSLSNYCFDLRFQRPRVEQIKAAMMSMSYKEGIKIPPPALNEIILAANQDVRQVIHNLSMWSVKDKNLTYEQVKEDSSKAKKDLKMGPFDVCRKVFAAGEETVNEKSDLFFHDYSFGPLFVHENYISVTPFAGRGDTKKHLQLLSRAADSIAAGDLVDRRIRSAQNWNLLPTQAIFSSVIPGEAMRGSLGQMVQFPCWLGKNSSRNKNDRLLQELRLHMRLKVSADKKGLNMEYLPHMRKSLTQPLITQGQEGVKTVVEQLDEYDLIREDYDSILDVSQWPNTSDPMKQIDPKVKAAFTRAYNKESHMTPYSTGAAPKKGRGRAGGDGGMDDLEGLEGQDGEGTQNTQEEEDEDDIGVDTMIKKKKAGTAKAKAGATDKGKGGKGKTTAGKGRGKGKGK